MHGITSLDGHGKASGDMNKAMERMSIVFKGRLSPEQLNQIKSDIQTTAMSGMAGDMLSAAGQGGDTMMAHMSPETIGMAQEMGILPQGQMNPMTGLPSFFDTAEGGMSGLGGVDGSTGADGQGDEVNDEDEDDDTRDPAGTTAEMGGGAPSASQGSPGAEAMGGLGGGAFSGDTPPAGPGIADAYAGLSQGYTQAGLTYGVKNTDLVGRTKQEKEDLIDRIIDARHAQDPTMAQLSLNQQTERGFQQANPGITQAVGVAGTLLGLAVPPIGFANMLGNTVNAATGRPTMVDMALGIKAGDPLSGPTQAIADFSKDSGLMSGIQSLAEAAGPAPTETAADVEMAEQGLGNENFVPDESGTPTTEEEPAPDQFSEKAKLLGAGYSESDAQTIIDNFGTLDTFQQRFEGRFGVPPTPAQLMEADKQQFINIRRGRPVGMGSGIGSLRT